LSDRGTIQMWTEIIALLAIGASVGGLVGVGFAWDRGFQAGVKWTCERFGVPHE
jgi:hypothetical protein